MQGYRPEKDKDSIFQSLCRAIESDPQQYRHDAERLLGEVNHYSKESLQPLIELSDSAPDGLLKDQLRAIAHKDSFKYSRLFGIGIYTILEKLDADLVKSKKTLDEALATLSPNLNLPEDKISKDLELYQSNLEKLIQAQAVLDDMLKADRKKREQREEGENQPSPEQPDSADEVSASPE
jgi:photosystem II biogenesis protein Psp29